jgi:hypothetical protein
MILAHKARQPPRPSEKLARPDAGRRIIGGLPDLRGRAVIVGNYRSTDASRRVIESCRGTGLGVRRSETRWSEDSKEYRCARGGIWSIVDEVAERNLRP